MLTIKSHSRAAVQISQFIVPTLEGDVDWESFGYIAALPIPRGTRLLREWPLISIPADVYRTPQTLHDALDFHFACISPERKRRFFNLPNLYFENTPRLAGIAYTNCLRHGDWDHVFAGAGRITHACIPNVAWTWNDDGGFIVVHALRDIAPGEEITMARVLNCSRKQRHATLRYTCICGGCSYVPRGQERSDHRRRFLRHMETNVGPAVPLDYDLPGLLALWQAAVATTRIEYGAVAVLFHPKYYAYIALAAATFGDVQRAAAFARRAYLASCTVHGADHSHTAKAHFLFKNPRAFCVYEREGHGTVLAPTCEPRRGTEAYEEWLWKPCVRTTGPAAPASS